MNPRAIFLGPKDMLTEITQRAGECGVETIVGSERGATLALVWLEISNLDDGDLFSETGDLPIIALMRDATPSLVDWAYKRGVHGYFALSEPMGVFRAVIRSAIASAGGCD